MPAKVSTLCYVHNCSDRVTQEFIVKEMTAIVKTDNNDSTKVAFLKTKIFIPINEMATHHIGQFEIGDVVFLKGKFIIYENYYIVSATSIKVTTLDFDSMPATGKNVIVTGFTTQMVKNIEGNMTLEFYVEEKELVKENLLTSGLKSDTMRIIHTYRIKQMLLIRLAVALMHFWLV
ncbi:hypothetical protein C2G38_2110080 [Gigaspora rosea]|uniref:Uncharacterized protein n=1 Tax=Gigaspora rosea TaxID=44941 RepID=A0A397UFC0_9GLOM|nr:hypothetical protein C2G38_2110080 [Gigaspora rosea]